MAIFNPTVPDTQDPNWLGWSKSITQPEGNKSTALAIGAVGEGLGDALKLADTSMKSIIEDDIYDKAKAEQSNYQQRLASADETIRNARLNPVAAGPNAASSAANTGAALQGDQNILNTPTSPQVPNALQNLPVQVDTLGAARANGKLSETDYYARLDTMAKDFRSKYPGYKEFIDSTMQKVTGVDSANKYIQSVLGDINTFATNTNAERSKVITELQKPEVAGSPEGQRALALFNAGKLNTVGQAMAIVAPAYQRKYEHDTKLRAVAEFEGDEKVKSNWYSQVATDAAFKHVQAAIPAMILGDKPQQQSLQDYIIAHGPGSGKELPETQWIDLGRAIDANKSVAYNTLWKSFNEPIVDPKTGQTKPSIVQQLGKPKVDEIISGQLKWYDDQHALITDKDLGSMHYSARMLEASTNNVARRLVGNNPYFAVAKIATAVGGVNFVNSATFGTIISQVDAPDKDALLAAGTSMAIQTGLRVYNGLPAPDGKVTTLGSITTTANTPPNPNDPQGPSVTPKFNKAIPELAVKMFTDPKQNDDVKTGYARAMFDPQNKGYLGLIKGMDNKYSTYQKMSTPDVQKEIYRLGQSDPKLWEMYKGWLNNEFSNQLMNNEVRTINSLPDSPSIKLTWNDEAHQFGLDVGNHTNVHLMSPNKFSEVIRGTSLGNVGVPGESIVQRAAQAVNRLNTGLSPIIETYKKDNKPIESSVLELLKGAHIEGGAIPSKLLDPFRTRALQYNEENAPSSGALDEFVKNPFQGVPTPRPLENNAPASLSGAPRPLSAATVPKKTRNQTNYGVDEESFNSRFNGYNR